VILHTLQQANTGPLDRRAITKLFRRIIRESRRVEAQTLERVVSGDGEGDKSKFIRHSSTPHEALL
jgi:hypothetical protein